MSGLMGGSWRRTSPAGHPRVPGRCAERRHPNGLVGTQPVGHLEPRQLPTRLRFGNSAWVFDKIRKYAVMRVALFVAKRHQRCRSWGFAQMYRSPVQLGLVSLNGIVVAPRPNRSWRAPAEHRGEGRR